MTERQQQAELLDRYWTSLRQDPTALPPDELDPEIVSTVKQMEHRLHPPEPAATFARALQQKLADEAAAMARRQNSRAPKAVGSWPILHLAAHGRWGTFVGLATAAVLVLAIISLATWISRTPTVSAQEILDKAQAAAVDAAAGGVHSFVLTEVGRSRLANPRLNADVGYTGREEIRTETVRWFQAPSHWRIESAGSVFAPDGKELPDKAWRQVIVADGKDVWSYDVPHNTIQVNELSPNMAGKDGLSRFGQDASDLDTVLKRASTCGTPVIKGTETVAGRTAYVIDLGTSTCPSASVPEMNGRSVLWIDKETFFVLKHAQYSGVDGQLLSTTEVTSIQYDSAIDPTRFTFTPPSGAKIQDFRPKPAPAADELQQQLRQLAQRVDFPLFAPRDVPAGLVPLQPRLDDVDGPQVQLGYVPPDEAGKTAIAGATGVRITQRKASYELVDRWTAQAQPTTIPGGQGWLRRGLRNPDGTGSDSAAIVLRDGTLISVTSFDISPDELVKIASSLEPVPGSHAPLPNPTPPTLAGIRQRVAFPVFVPTWVPSGLTPEPPAGGEQPTQNVEIRYHTSDGGIALTVLQGRAGCCLDADPRKGGQTVTLPNGIAAHFLDVQPEHGGPILWWEQDGTYVAVSGPRMTKDDLVKIAASLSKTADLGQTEVPPARPTPTPVPAATFTVLRPTWLPEPMTVHEQEAPNPDGPGSGVILTFDPRPGDKPHDLLTLREFPKGEKQSPIEDPQAMTEQIGGRTVTIVRRGTGCVLASWVQGDVVLTLNNPYDPPGQPGQVRYSCDQFRHVIESIQ